MVWRGPSASGDAPRVRTTGILETITFLVLAGTSQSQAQMASLGQLKSLCR